MDCCAWLVVAGGGGGVQDDEAESRSPCCCWCVEKGAYEGAHSVMLGSSDVLFISSRSLLLWWLKNPVSRGVAAGDDYFLRTERRLGAPLPRDPLIGAEARLPRGLLCAVAGASDALSLDDCPASATAD
jgi:hypothetical protein